ncbi:UDP-N-acetylglucosamine 1-carboxyvinyltransferase [Patescibacteria group bacterium]|mgnify:CR=1 FL=1|nr:UDP-N-acetylglucosamine 1-carboxyvinyltransferase [Patescibacteria group bacterium]
MNAKSVQEGQKQIGAFIRNIRKQRGLTQAEFAEKLETSQSAVARMERGGLNFSTRELIKIGKVLDHQLIKLHHEERDDFIINGGKKLSGSIITNTSKNGAMGLMHAALLNKGTTTIHGVPEIQEVFRVIEIFESIGVKVEWLKKDSIQIIPPKRFKFDQINKKSARSVRSFMMSIGPLIHHLKSFEIPTAGGCKMGERTIAAHRHGIEALGVRITTRSTGYLVERKKLKPAEIVMYEASDTATENIIIAAAGIPGKTIIHFAQQNYMVQDVCFFLQRLGVKIEGIGSLKLTIHGKKNINQDIEHYNSEDPIESMMFIASAIVTNSELTIKRCPIDFLKLELLKLQKMGVVMDISKVYKSKNKQTDLVNITVRESNNLRALSDKIHAQPYPGINTDNLPFFVPVALQAKGTTLIHDWMWENRAIYFTELNRLGASVRIADPHRVFIEGGQKLTAGEIICPPALRPSTMIMVAMLGIEGRSILRNVYAIKRGYENIVERLNSIGADIQVVKEI